MARPLVGQTVVTDPDTGRSGGYVLVAASPDVPPADAQHLSAAPHVTDYLHLEASPRPCFSFYPLPSGRWALARRFVRGTRRGAFNRVVAHTLLIPPEVLSAVAEEPWLLLTRCRFRPAGGGPEMSPAELGERAAAAGSAAGLPDLECLPPADPVEERLALLRRRREVLRKRWSDAELASLLQAIFAAIASSGNVLLPQDSDSEQLLALGWSALPAGDRCEAPWTTHLAPSAAAVFRCANAPEPEAVRRDQADPGRWFIPGQPPLPEDPGQGGEALASFLVRDGSVRDGRPRGGDLLGELYDGLGRQRARLAEHSAEIRRFIVWLQRGGSAIAEGFDDPARLAELLAELRSPGARPLAPWIGLPHLLSCAASSALALLRRGGTAPASFAQIYQILEDTRWRQRLLAPPVLAELVRAAASGKPTGPRIPAGVVPAAIRLAALALPAPPAGAREREEVLALAVGCSGSEGSEAADVLAETLAELAVDLGRSASPAVDSAVGALAHQPGGLERLLGKVTAAPRPAPEGPAVRDLPLLMAALRAAGSGSTLGRLIAAEHVVPLLLREPQIFESRDDADFLAWSATVRELADAAEADGAPGASSRLRARWWLELARRSPRHVPAEALRMLDDLHGDDRATVARAWHRRLAELGRDPAARKLVTRLAGLAGDDPELAFTYAVEDLAAALRAGELDLEGAVSRAARLSRGGPSGDRGALVQALRKLLPAEPVAHARAVVGLLLSPRLLPSSKRVLDTAFRDRALAAAGDDLAGALPRVGELAGRGALLLRTADLLGERWRGDPAAATGFVREAARLERFDAVASFLAGADKHGDHGSAAFLDHLGRHGEPHLSHRLAAAASNAPSRWDLQPFAARLQSLAGRAATGRAATGTAATGTGQGRRH